MLQNTKQPSESTRKCDTGQNKQIPSDQNDGHPVPTIACLSLETPKLEQNGYTIGLPRTWSNPQIVSHLRPDIESPQLQKARGKSSVYEMDITRGIIIKGSRENVGTLAERRKSMPDLG